MDGLYKEAQHSKPASAKPSKTLTSSERESSPRPSGEVQPGTTKKATVTGAARPLSATRTEQTKTTGRVGPCRTKSPGRLAAYDAVQAEEDTQGPNHPPNVSSKFGFLVRFLITLLMLIVCLRNLVG